MAITANSPIESSSRPHPRSIGWVGTTALALGGSNQSLFIIGALVLAQGTGAVPLLAIGLLLSWAAAPGWTELVLMWPDRVGGIAATCGEAFRPYSAVLANLAGTCYWWGWVPTCGLTAILSATALHQWFLPGVPVSLLATGIVGGFTAVNLCGVRWVTRLAIPIASLSALFAFLSGIVPLLAGDVSWQQASDFHLSAPFPGFFGGVTSAMAGLYLIGFAAPAFEAAACHVGETKDPERNVPRAMFASGALATLYFLVLPVVWLGALGPGALAGDLAQTLGPTFAPVLGSAAKSAAIGFMVFNMFHGTLQPLAGAARTLSQLSEDGLVPRVLARRSRTDAPWVATLVTAAMSIVFLVIGDPTWMIAAANLTYLIGICLPSVAVWLLRRHEPARPRPYRAPRGTITLGLIAAAAWMASTVLGFEQFGLPTVLFGVALAYSGTLLYAWRCLEDRRRERRRRLVRSLHLKLSGAMLLVLTLDGAGYLIAVQSAARGDAAQITMLKDIFVAVALLTISVGLILPGMIAHAAGEVARSADRLARGTLVELRRAIEALGDGDLDAAHASADVQLVIARSRDEVGAMAKSFNSMQHEIARAALSLDGARDGLRSAREELATLATTDPLTGLPNRRLFYERLDALVAEADRSATGFALMLIDLDGFKEVNDTLGHQSGDRLLCEVATRLANMLPANGFLARLGGDEFAALLPPGSSAASARRTARRLGELLDRPVTLDDLETTVTASVGAAIYPVHGRDPETLVRHADVAMYVAKAEHTRCEVYAPARDRNSRDRLTLAADLRRALENGDLHVHYQPQVVLATDAVTGVEALVRWTHPTGGSIGPSDFVPLAERHGLIRPLILYVLEAALRARSRWAANGVDLDIAVNLSASNLLDRRLVDDVAGLLRATRTEPGRLELELTESMIMAEPERARKALANLSDLGVLLSLDDFGTGYSSLGRLASLPISRLKIDRSFVTDMTRAPANAAIVRSTIELAHGLDLSVTAEGLEDETTRARLAALGCDLAQGYLLSPPIPSEEIPPWVERWRSGALPHAA